MRVDEMCDIMNACVKCNDKLIKYKANNQRSFDLILPRILYLHELNAKDKIDIINHAENKFDSL
jgi:hypothetical protein